MGHILLRLTLIPKSMKEVALPNICEDTEGRCGDTGEIQASFSWISESPRLQNHRLSNILASQVDPQNLQTSC